MLSYVLSAAATGEHYPLSNLCEVVIQDHAVIERALRSSCITVVVRSAGTIYDAMLTRDIC
jgi:hypothetical protein